MIEATLKDGTIIRSPEVKDRPLSMIVDAKLLFEKDGIIDILEKMGCLIDKVKVNGPIKAAIEMETSQIPAIKNADIITWTGDDARFIALNLREIFKRWKPDD